MATEAHKKLYEETKAMIKEILWENYTNDMTIGQVMTLFYGKKGKDIPRCGYLNEIRLLESMRDVLKMQERDFKPTRLCPNFDFDEFKFNSDTEIKTIQPNGMVGENSSQQKKINNSFHHWNTETKKNQAHGTKGENLSQNNKTNNFLHHSNTEIKKTHGMKNENSSQQRNQMDQKSLTAEEEEAKRFDGLKREFRAVLTICKNPQLSANELITTHMRDFNSRLPYSSYMELIHSMPDVLTPIPGTDRFQLVPSQKSAHVHKFIREDGKSRRNDQRNFRKN